MTNTQRNAAIRRKMAAYTRKITASRETARAELARAGLTAETREAKDLEEMEAMRKAWAEHGVHAA